MKIDEDALFKYVGDKIRAYRLEHEITQNQLANEIGVTRASISNVEAGMQKLPLQLLYRICAVLDVEIVNLLPHVSEIIKSADDNTMEIGGQVKQLSPKTALFF